MPQDMCLRHLVSSALGFAPGVSDVAGIVGGDVALRLVGITRGNPGVFYIRKH